MGSSPWPVWKCDSTALVVSHADSGAHTGPKDPGPTGATWAPVQKIPVDEWFH
jgi:hypothetical protein